MDNGITPATAQGTDSPPYRPGREKQTDDLIEAMDRLTNSLKQLDDQIEWLMNEMRRDRDRQDAAA